ncbi:hypothetical protein VTJ04DRAFT_6273 [Mycothermus thermophilus]|uniref:uncharacterized protein n=1 Tax=Humicola insolens TaxID=85995 RepID=UPI003743BCBE
MGMLDPLMSLGLGRSPYDLVVMGEGPEDPRTRGQLYDDRGRPVNPETKRINRDVVRSHNEVMAVIGVAEPENGSGDAQLEAAQRHRRYEDRVGGRLLLAGSILQTTAIWGVNGMRQRILLYKPFSHTTFYGMWEHVRRQQSVSSYFLNGLPSFMTSTVLEHIVVEYRQYPIVRWIGTYIRLHLAIYTFFQRTGILPSTPLLPNWRFFIPGTSRSPIHIPRVESFRPRGLAGWLFGIAVGVTPFVGFYLYTQVYNVLVGAFRSIWYTSLPRPYNPGKRRATRHSPSSGATPAIDVRAEPTLSATPDSQPQQSDASPTPSTNDDDDDDDRGNGNTSTEPSGATAPPNPPPGQDDFASDDEDTEIISATLISFDVESTEPMPDPDTSNPANGNSGGGRNDNTPPGVWAAELRPSFIESHGVEGAALDGEGSNSGSSPGDDSGTGSARAADASSSSPAYPRYRDSILMRLPAMLATDVLAIGSARLLVVPLASMVWIALAKSYISRRVPGLQEGLDEVLGRPGWWWGLSSARGLRNLVGLELLLAMVQGEAWALIMLLADRFRFTEEEWVEIEKEVGDMD